MSCINVKLRLRQARDKFRKLVSAKENIYPSKDEMVSSFLKYRSGASLENDNWFYVDGVSSAPYANDIIKRNFDSVDFESLCREDFDKIDYLFVEEGEVICFQKISKTRLVAKKAVFYIGEGFKYENNRQEIVINDLPDAIYNREQDCLYFRRLEAITGIFKGIDQLYREATEPEVRAFLNSNFISLQNGYQPSDVKAPNRKRIALANDVLKRLSANNRRKILSYIQDYCPDLKVNNGMFDIGSESELQQLLYGIDQRYYTTLIGGEKRLANSVILL